MSEFVDLKFKEELGHSRAISGLIEARNRKEVAEGRVIRLEIRTEQFVRDCAKPFDSKVPLLTLFKKILKKLRRVSPFTSLMG